MSFAKIPREVIRDKEISAATEYIYSVIVDLADYMTHIAEVKISTIARIADKSQRTVRRHIAILIKLGLIIRILRKNPNEPKLNMPNLFLVRGENATRYADKMPENNSDTSTWTKMAKLLDKNVRDKEKRDSLREIIESNSKREAKTPLQVRNEKKEPDPERKRKAIDMAVKNVPDVMRPVAEYLLHKTGKFHFTAHEIEVLRSFVDTHTPLRVMKEIDTCCERFIRNGKNLRQLTFNYIGACLKNQRSLVKRQKPRVKNAPETHAEASVTQCEVQESVIIPESELSLPEAENIVAAFEPAKTNAETFPADTEALYERINAALDEKDRQYKEFETSLPHDENGFAVFPEDAEIPPCYLSLEEYLKLEYPEADEEELRIDDMREADREILEDAKSIDCACAACESDNDCCLSERYKIGGMRPIAALKAYIRGKKHIIPAYGGCLHCKHGGKKVQSDPEYERRLKFSGLTEKQSHQTFDAYMHEGTLPEIVVAKAKAIRAAQNESNLILAGKAGTGKTHLAIAIAIEAMKHKRSALFRSVPELLDELRERARNNDDFFRLMHRCKEVSCLVLDDLGKQKTTDAGMDYLYQIIDYRYKNGKQTIVTTNALSVNELENRFNEGKIEPLLSRILENGDCAVLRTADNYRFKKQHEVKIKPEEKPLPTPTEVQVEPEQESANEPVEPEQPEERSGGITSISGIFSQRKKCSSLKEILDYRRKYGEFPPEYESLNISDKAYLNRLLYAEYLEEQEKAKQAEKKISVALNTDLYEEDEDEYRLYGDTGLPCDTSDDPDEYDESE